MNPHIFCLLLVLATAPTLLGSENAEARKAGSAASDFFNAYVQAIPKLDGYKATIDWVKKNPLASPAYKAAVEKIYLDALKKDPEMGYGADALLGAQDFPDGFRIKKSNASADKAVVDLIGLDPFPLPLRVTLVRKGDQWLVDGSGDLLR